MQAIVTILMTLGLFLCNANLTRVQPSAQAVAAQSATEAGCCDCTSCKCCCCCCKCGCCAKCGGEARCETGSCSGGGLD